MSVREFRRLSRDQRRRLIRSVHDPLTQQILTAAFLDFGHRSWVQVALYIGGGNTADGVRMLATRELHRM